jgi:hypothetical protein
MADIKFSALGAVTSFDGTEILPLIKGGNPANATFTNLATAVLARDVAALLWPDVPDDPWPTQGSTESGDAQIINGSLTVNGPLSVAGFPLYLPGPIAASAVVATVINATAAACSAAGGGVLQLAAGTISITASLNILTGVTYNGAGYVFAEESNAITGGTNVVPTGAFPAFAGNATDLGSQQANSATLVASGIFGCGVTNLATTGGTYGIKIGALYQGGPAFSRFANLMHLSATVWGSYYENPNQCSWDNIAHYVTSNHAMALVGSGTNLWNFGNSHLRKIVVNGGGGANGSGRALQVFSRVASELNNISVFDLGASGSTVTSTQACTMAAPIATTITNTSASIAATNTFAAGDAVGFSATTGTSGGQVVLGTTYYVSATGLSGSAFQVSATVGGAVITFNASGTPNVLTAKFAVTDLSKFGVGMPVFFSATVNGLTINIIYFVLTVSGTSGAGNLTVCPFMSGSAGSGSVAIPMTAASAVNITTQGWPLVEFGGADAGSTITWSSIKGASDIEVGGTAHIVLQGVAGFDFEGGTIHAAGSKADICVRNSSSIRIFNPQSGTTSDFDAIAQRGVSVYGTALVPVNTNFQGIGIVSNGANGPGMLSLNGGVPDMVCNTSFFSQIQMQNAFARKHTTVANGATLGSSNGNLMTNTTAAASTVTLPSITGANLAGWDQRFSNPSANTLTVNAATGTAIATTITNTSASIAATNTFAAGMPVVFSATVGTSGGLVTAGVVYFVIAAGLTGTTFEVSATLGGTAITFNASGTPTVSLAQPIIASGTLTLSAVIAAYSNAHFVAHYNSSYPYWARYN